MEIIFSILIILISAWLGIFYAIRKQDKLLENYIKQQQMAQETKRLEELDTALAQWLLMLELPQLEEETKRQEAACQLSTLLIGKLMLRRCPVRPSKSYTHHESKFGLSNRANTLNNL
jgi:hypothetical protein